MVSNPFHWVSQTKPLEPIIWAGCPAAYSSYIVPQPACRTWIHFLVLRLQTSRRTEKEPETNELLEVCVQRSESSTYPCLPPSVCVSSLTLFVRSRRRWHCSHQSGSPPGAARRTRRPRPGMLPAQTCGRRRRGGLSRASPAKSLAPPASTPCGCGGSPWGGGGGYAPPPGHTPRSWCSQTRRVCLWRPLAQAAGWRNQSTQRAVSLVVWGGHGKSKHRGGRSLPQLVWTSSSQRQTL